MLTSLLLFNQYIAELRPTIAPEARVFVGAQFNPDEHADAWTKCVPENGVYVTQLSERAKDFEPDVLRVVAAHELCHARLHGKMMCEGAEVPGAAWTVQTRMRVEQEATLCAAEFLGKER